MRYCSVAGCNEPYSSKDLCRKHYDKMYREAHRELKNRLGREYHHRNKERLRSTRRERQYGLTPDLELALLKGQDGRCAICHSLPSGNRKKVLSVDHDHVSGKIRGLLCDSCNRAIGYLKDDPSRARAVAEYLEKYA